MKPLALAIAFVLGLGALGQACDQCQKAGQPVATCTQAVQTVQATPIKVAVTKMVPVTKTVQVTEMVATTEMVDAVAIAAPACTTACAKQRRTPFADARAAMADRRADRASARAAKANAKASGSGCHGSVQTVALISTNCSGGGGANNGGQGFGDQPRPEATPEQSSLPPTPNLR